MSVYKFTLLATALACYPRTAHTQPLLAPVIAGVIAAPTPVPDVSANPQSLLPLFSDYDPALLTKEKLANVLNDGVLTISVAEIGAKIDNSKLSSQDKQDLKFLCQALEPYFDYLKQTITDDRLKLLADNQDTPWTIPHVKQFAASLTNDRNRCLLIFLYDNMGVRLSKVAAGFSEIVTERGSAMTATQKNNMVSTGRNILFQMLLKENDNGWQNMRQDCNALFKTAGSHRSPFQLLQLDYTRSVNIQKLLTLFTTGLTAARPTHSAVNKLTCSARAVVSRCISPP